MTLPAIHPGALEMAAPLAAIRPGPLTVAVILAAVAAWRWGRMSNENRILAIVAAAGLAVYGSGVVHPPSLEKLVKDAGQALGSYTYILVGVAAFLETGAFIGLIAPGETVVIVGGLVAGQGHIDILLLIGLVWACAVAGDNASFLLGRRLGRDFLLRHGERVRITEPRLKQVEDFLARHGGATILIGRFIGLVRALAPFVAGASRMPLRRFLPYDIVAAGAWSTVFCLLGYIFWQSFDQVLAIAKRGALAFATVVGIVVAGVAAYRYLRVPENRDRARAWIDEQAQRPALRPVARALRPVYRRVLLPAWRWLVPAVRFLCERITPGQLGLELTTLLAVAAVGSFTFVVLGSMVDSHSALRTDMRAFDLGHDLTTDTLTDMVKVFTALGSLPVTGVATAATVAFLTMRRRPIEGAALALGLVLTWVAVDIAKDAFDRPRPADPLVHANGLSYPSAHAAYSVAYVGIAIALGHAFPRFVYRAGLTVAAIVLSALIGLSRVYLRVHYLSDVLGGWGLAATLFAACGLMGLIVSFIRHNEAVAR